MLHVIGQGAPRLQLMMRRELHIRSVLSEDRSGGYQEADPDLTSHSFLRVFLVEPAACYSSFLLLIMMQAS